MVGYPGYPAINTVDITFCWQAHISVALHLGVEWRRLTMCNIQVSEIPQSIFQSGSTNTHFH